MKNVLSASIRIKALVIAFLILIFLPVQVWAMVIHVHVKEKTIDVQCAHGPQPIKWLGDVAVARYDNAGGVDLGRPSAITKLDGTVLDMKGIIKDLLRDGEHVIVELRDPVTGLPSH